MSLTSAEKRINVITIQGAIDTIGCSRTVFYEQHYKNLVQVPKVGRNVYFNYEQFQDYLKGLTNKSPDYNIVK